MALSMMKPRDLIRVHDEKADPWRIVCREKGPNKQLEIMHNALARYGLSQNEIRAYVYLAKADEKKAAEIAEAISLHRTEAYRTLRDLEKRGIVLSTFEKPLRFTAVPLDKAIERLMETEKTRLKLLEKEKADLIQLWSSMPKPRNDKSKKEVFQILEGESQVILKANDLLGKTRTELRIFAPEEYLAQLYRSDFMDNLEQRSYDVSINLLTEDSLKSRFFCERIGWSNHSCCVGDVSKLPCFIISDREELLIVYSKKSQDEGRARKKRSRTAALWTNSNALVASMLALFYRMAEARETAQVCAAQAPEIGLQMEDRHS
ncbi:MAG: helix-turn-helix domain-containing protein [Candidatus Bathyarchaeia archaeon]